MFIKPRVLEPGDTVATISLSGGSAVEADMHWRYLLAKERLQHLFGLKVIETENSQKGRQFLYEHPRARAEDLMAALMNKSVKAVLLNQGGDDGIRTLPFIDFGVIKENPKIFMGYSDGTIFTSMFNKAGVVSFYGPNVLTTLSEPGGIHEYTERWIRKALFGREAIGTIEPAFEWTSESIDWSSSTQPARKMTTGAGYEVLQGKGRVSGRLIGGCVGPLQAMMGTSLWPEPRDWNGSIVFIEGMPPYGLELATLHSLRAFAAAGVFRSAAGVIFSKAATESEECKRVILKVIKEEEGLGELPILLNLDCGHTAPMTVIPFGVTGEIDCEKRTFSITESAVQ